MGIQTQEGYQYQTSLQIQGTPQRRRQKTRIRLKFIRDVLTCHDLVHHSDGDSPFNHQWMEYTPGGLHPGLSSSQHQVQYEHGDYPRK